MSEGYVLPPDLAEIDTTMADITHVARRFEELLNEDELPLDDMIDTTEDMINHLNRWVADSYEGKTVEVSGTYTVPKTFVDEIAETIESGPIEEVGIRRAKAAGFFATITSRLVEDDGELKEKPLVKFYHHAYLQRATLITGLQELTGFDLLRAPIDESSICLGAVVDFFETQQAVEAISKPDELDLTQELDQIMYGMDDIDMADLHDFLMNLQRHHADRLDDFLVYINRALCLNGAPLELLSNFIIAHSYSDKREIYRGNDIVYGIGAGIDFGESFVVNNNSSTPVPIEEKQPLLRLHARLEARDGERLIQVPLSEIVAISAA